MIVNDGIRGIELFRTFVPIYGLMIVLGLLTSMFIVRYLCYKYQLNMDNMIIIACSMGIGAYIGSKLLFILVSFDIIDWASIFSFQGLHKFLSSGFVFYGGLFGSLFFGIMTAKKVECYFINYLIIFFVSLPLGHAFGRIGCYLAGCCYGVPYDGFGSVIYHGLLYTPNNISLFPVQLIESLCNLLIFVFLITLIHRKGLTIDAIYYYFISYGITRFALEFFRYDELRKFFIGLSTSQWISIILIIVAIIKIVFHKDIISTILNTEK